MELTENWHVKCYEHDVENDLSKDKGEGKGTI